MDEATAAIVGVVVGAVMQPLIEWGKGWLRGSKFESAVQEELEVAKNHVHRKMLWVSRHNINTTHVRDKDRLVEHAGKVLYLGEDELFEVPLFFWKENMREIIEAVSSASFKRMCKEIGLVKEFVSKFADMKLAFKVKEGPPGWMALACYSDLILIHNKLCSEKVPEITLPTTAQPVAMAQSAQ